MKMKPLPTGNKFTRKQHKNMNNHTVKVKQGLGLVSAFLCAKAQ